MKIIEKNEGKKINYNLTINHIENPNLLATKIIVPHKLIPRESCCPPPEVYSNSTF